MSEDTPPPEASAAVVAQAVRQALRKKGYKPRDLTVRREVGGSSNTVFVCLKRLGLVLADVLTIAMPHQRVNLDEKDRPRIDMRHIYVRVEFEDHVVEPLRVEVRKVLQALRHGGDRIQIHSYVVSVSPAGFAITSASVTRARRTVTAKALSEAVEIIAQLVAADGHVKIESRLF